jgi:WD40 repeat protein
MGFASKSGPSTGVTIAPAFHDLLAGVRTSVMLFSVDSRQLLYVADGGIVRWDVAGRAPSGPPLPLPRGIREPSAAAISGDGRLLALGSRGGSVTLLDAQTGQERGRARSHGDRVNTLAFSPDGNLLASGGADARIYIYQARSGEELYRLRGPDKEVQSLAFSPDGRYLIAASEDKTIRAYDVNVQKEVRALKDPASHVLSADISDDGTLIALATKHVKIDLRRNTRQDTELIKVRDLKTGEELLALEGHDKAITDVAFFPGRRFLASAGRDEKINIWDLQQGTPIATLRTRGAVLAMRVSPDGRWLAGADESGRIQIWKTR